MIMLVGEAWGREEEDAGAPFVGASGRLLKACLRLVGISYDECYVTNVFNFRPKPSNDIKNLCGPKTEAIPGFPALVKGKYVRVEFKPEVDRLLQEIENVRPTLIVALGGTASWALLHTSGIKGIRGTTYYHRCVRNGIYIKVLPTYHPAAVLREFKLKPIFMSDLDKARRESTYREIRRPSRKIWVEPTLDDLHRFEREYILPSNSLSIDIETAGDQITCIGFAPTDSVALVVPFFDKVRKNYWPTVEDEIAAWNWVKRICALPKSIVGQNFLYDLNFTWTKYGIPVPHVEDDTMLLHHALHPEMEKGLGFLASVYTDEGSWKFMRKKHMTTVKRED